MPAVKLIRTGVLIACLGPRRARLLRQSIINSVADTLFMVLGFFLARWWPVWLTVTVAVALELIVGYMTRDQSHAQCADAFWPVQSILDWQAGR
jgi:Protein of unknown function (DUF2585)